MVNWMATCDQLMLHVSLETRRTCEPPDEVAEKVADSGRVARGAVRCISD